MIEDTPLCTKTDDAVRDYAAEILASASAYDEYKGLLEIEYDLCINTEQTFAANSATICSDIGIVMVFPDFRQKSAQACILNVGLMNAMVKEGYDDEHIKKEGKVYGKLLQKNEDNVEMFSYFLTHKLDKKGSHKNKLEDKE